MTERERWIVYPLLFLALGAALRDKLFDTTMSGRIVCQELVVVNEGKYPDGPVPLVRIGAQERSMSGNPPSALIEVNGRVDAGGYFVRGVPMSAPVRTVIPGISFRDLYRALQQAAEQRQRGDTVPKAQPRAPNTPGPRPPSGVPNDAGDAPSTPPQADGLAPPNSQPSPPTRPSSDQSSAA